MTGPVKGNLPASRADSDTDFAARLRAQMRDREISVAQLADATGIAERLIRRYRSTGPNRSRPVDYFGNPTANALALASALECTLETLGLSAVQEKPAA